MIVKCKRDGGYHLTPGKFYEVMPIKNEIDLKLFKWIIKNDIGHEHYVEEDLFFDISETRHDKLTELGI